MPLLTQINKNLNVISGGVFDNTPRYTNLYFDQSDYNEGDTITIVLDSAFINDNTTVGYTITGVSSEDLSGASLTGQITILGGIGQLTFNINEDGITEGVDTMIITLASTDSNGVSTGSRAASATIQDTSFDPTRQPWLDNNDDIATVRSIISGIAMQLNGVFTNPTPVTPLRIEGRTSGLTTTIRQVTAITATYIEVDHDPVLLPDGTTTAFTIGEEINIIN
jgi:hypothetical protein